MKTSTLFKKPGMLLILGLFLLPTQLKAQDQIAELLQAGSADASKLIDAYTTPLIKGFGAGINQGWYNTAKTHGLGRFDLTFTLNGVFVPDKDLTYDASSLNFSELTLDNPNNKIAQTLLGDANPGPNNPEFVLRTDDPSNPGTPIEVARFAAPEGLGVPYSAAPTIQLAVGLIKNTEVMVRYVPTISFGDYGDLSMTGFGIKHDIKQWIPVVNKLPFDMSAFYGFTKLNYSYGFEYAPEAGVPIKTGSNTDFSNQEMNFKTNASTFGLIVSKKILLLTVYGGVNYQTSKSDLKLKGNYPVTVIGDDPTNVPQFGQKVVESVTDPVAFDVAGANGVTATLGARVKLLIFTLQGSYTFAKYPIATVGLGLNLDWK